MSWAKRCGSSVARDLGELHRHTHGEHTHDHQHPSGGPHVHGWHSPPWACNGDEGFGLEPDADPQPHLAEPEVLRITPGSLLVVMPYIKQLDRPETIAAVLEQAGTVVRQDVGGSQYDYWELTRQLWADQVAFCYVEHDIVIPEGAIAQFESCPEDWCAHDYRLRPEQASIYETYTKGMAFGIVRFRPAIMARYPDLIENHTWRSWWELDGQTVHALLARNETCHRHYPDAGHLHDYARPQSWAS